jgi:dGTP triphosphohydrolase
MHKDANFRKYIEENAKEKTINDYAIWHDVIKHPDEMKKRGYLMDPDGYLDPENFTPSKKEIRKLTSLIEEDRKEVILKLQDHLIHDMMYGTADAWDAAEYQVILLENIYNYVVHDVENEVLDNALIEDRNIRYIFETIQAAYALEELDR